MRTLTCLYEAIRRTRKNTAEIEDVLRTMKEVGYNLMRGDQLVDFLKELQTRSLKIENDLLKVADETGLQV